MAKSVKFMLRDISVGTWNPCKFQGLAMCIYKPSPREIETGEASRSQVSQLRPFS